MTAIFPTVERNEMLRLIADDPRYARQSQIKTTAPVRPPTRLVRAGRRDCTWGICRSMRSYVAETADQSIGGKAPKWIVRGGGGTDDFYIAKFGATNGHIEVLTELFNNMLGKALGFNMAHHGIARLDDHIYFLTRNFRNQEALIHGSLLVADVLASDQKELDVIARGKEQEFYSVDFICDAIARYCGQSSSVVLQGFVNMLLFDALIGSQDRHAKNWGVLRPETAPTGTFEYRLAPLFDSARALLWDMPEGRLLILDRDDVAFDRYVSKSKPCIGPARSELKSNKCNHLDLITNLATLYPHHTEEAFSLIAGKDIPRVGDLILRKYPFNRGFSALRKRVILKVLERRAEQIDALLGKERGNVRNSTQRAAA